MRDTLGRYQDVLGEEQRDHRRRVYSRDPQMYGAEPSVGDPRVAEPAASLECRPRIDSPPDP